MKTFENSCRLLNSPERVKLSLYQKWAPRWLVRLQEGLERAWSWAKFGWGCYDWDYGQMWRAFEFKLARMEKAMAEDQWGADSLRKAHQIRVARVLATRLVKEEWAEKEWEQFHALYPFKGFECINDRSEQEHEHMIHIFKLEAERKQKALNKLFRIIELHHEGWWT